MIIESGKYYRDESGIKIGPMLVCDPTAVDAYDQIAFFEQSGIGQWTADGDVLYGSHRSSLVAEWTEPTGSALDLPVAVMHTPRAEAQRPRACKITDPVNQPAHYTGHPSGVECIQITEHMSFCRGNAMKYIWRAGEKDSEVQDLEKAIWYLQREIGLIRANSA